MLSSSNKYSANAFASSVLPTPVVPKKINEPIGLLEFTDYALDYLAENGFDPQFGARPLKRLIQKQIVNQLSKKLLGGTIDKSKPVLVDVFDRTVVFRNEVISKDTLVV